MPSSVVWSGFGRPPLPGESLSSWTVNGRSLPFVPYDNYDDVLSGRLSARAVHRRSLAELPKADREAARIPLENANARILLLGATRDHVWPSGDMTRDLAATLRAAGKAEQTKVLVFEDASQFICGTGEELQRIAPVVNPEGRHQSPEPPPAPQPKLGPRPSVSWPDSSSARLRYNYGEQLTLLDPLWRTPLAAAVEDKLYKAQYHGSGTFTITKPKRKAHKKRQTKVKNPQRGARR